MKERFLEILKWIKEKEIHKNRKVLIGAGILLFIVIILFFAAHGKKSADDENGPRTAQAEKGDITDVLKLRGTISAAKKVPVISETMGQVVKLHVTQGETVEKGQVLMEIDPTQLLNRVEKQKLSLEKSEITFKNMQKEYERSEALSKENFIPESQLLEAKKSRDLADLDYQMAKKELEGLETQLVKVKISAPISGVITSKNVEEGEVVASSTEGSASKVLMTITDTTDKKIELSVTDVERSLIKLNQPVDFWLDAQPGKRFQSAISKIDAAATQPQSQAGGNSGGNEFQVEIPVKSEGDFPLGANVNVEVMLQSVRNVIHVPVDAIFKSEGKSFVYIVKGSNYKKRDVETGLSNAELIEVKQGLKEGEEVSLDEPDQKL